MNAKLWGNYERLVTLFSAQDLHIVQLIVVGLSVPAKFGRLDRLGRSGFLLYGNSLSLGAR